MPRSSTRASATPRSRWCRLGTTCTVLHSPSTVAPWCSSYLTRACEPDSPRSRARSRHGRLRRENAGQRCSVAHHRDRDGSEDSEERGGRALPRRCARAIRWCAAQSIGKRLTDADLIQLFRKEAPEARQVFNNGPGSVLASVQYRVDLSSRTPQRPGRLLVSGSRQKWHRGPLS